MTFKIILLLSSLINFHSEPVGKTYKVKVNETCKLFGDGGCSLTTFRVLKFSKSDVVISYEVIANCDPKEKEKEYESMYDNLTRTAKWNIKGNVISIEGFNDFGTLTLSNSKITGKDNIEFIEQHK